MKGPYERLKYEMRRVWECPTCHHRERTDGGVTSRRCSCDTDVNSGAGHAMSLVEDGCRPVHPREDSGTPSDDSGETATVNDTATAADASAEKDD